MEFERTTKYKRAGIITDMSLVLDAIRCRVTKKRKYFGHDVHVTGVRLVTYAAHGTDCSSCGVKGVYFAVEASPGQNSYHLNLYAVRNGKELMMTCDHTLARSLGGEHHVKNTTPMCTRCNNKKAQKEGKLHRELKEAGLLPERHKKGKVLPSTGETNGEERMVERQEPWLQGDRHQLELGSNSV